MKNVIKIIIGIIIFIILAFSITFGFIKLKIYLINKEANETVEKFMETLEENKTEKPDTEVNPEEPQVEKGTNIFYHNYLVIGAIEIPSLNLAYPIIDEITEDSMKKGIVILYGNGLNETGNTVLAGHAYLKGTYFSNINYLKNGDKIIITNAYGEKITYYVYDNFLADSNDSSFYNRETNGLREITLSTCTLEGEKRHIVLAKENKED